MGGKKPTARQDSLKVMRPDEGWVCEVEPANETQGPVIRSTLIGKGTPPSTYEGCATLYEIFERSVRLYPDNPCLGSRLTNEDGTPTDYKWMSYKEVSEKTTLLASGLLADAILPQDKIGVFGANSPEWFLAMQACNRVNAACFPLRRQARESAQVHWKDADGEVDRLLGRGQPRGRGRPCLPEDQDQVLHAAPGCGSKGTQAGQQGKVCRHCDHHVHQRHDWEPQGGHPASQCPGFRSRRGAWHAQSCELRHQRA